MDSCELRAEAPVRVQLDPMGVQWGAFAGSGSPHRLGGKKIESRLKIQCIIRWYHVRLGGCVAMGESYPMASWAERRIV